ncbi:protein NDRG1-like [Tropilaelaps mercedesae]|uniref:Protein NDRG1-like n=1 Tax=Tropilaelaps mercedesae TaxID=418985 RepID=A0A1V9XYM2_9ACAR|nr:protein NDRG1-like [Tropilaelaps mercedesae]
MDYNTEKNFISQFADISIAGYNEEVRRIDTPYGVFTVTSVGDPRLSALVTVHDIGLNHDSNFNSFFKNPEVYNLTCNVCVFHIDMPGQESGAETLVVNQKTYPTILELVSGFEFVLAEYRIENFIGLGYGAGAYILSLLALANPELVSNLVLINASAEPATWTDYAYMQGCAALMRTDGFSRGVQEYLRWYHCGRDEIRLSHLISTFDIRIFAQNPKNLADWMESYGKRPSLRLQRPTNSLDRVKERNFRCPVLLIVGQESPHLEETRKMFAQCDPQLVNILELTNCRTPLDECPMKVLEAMLLAFQGKIQDIA